MAPDTTSSFTGKEFSNPPLLLAVETSGLCGSVALVERERCIAEFSLQTGAPHSKRLLNAIDFLMREAQLAWPDLDAIAVSLGPGSFTGLRIGLSTVKGLSMAAGKPLLGVSSLDGLASQFPYAARQICAVIDARKKQVYAAFYAADGNGAVRRQGDQLVLTPEELTRRIDQPTILAGDGALLYRPLFRERLKDLALLAPQETHFLRAAAVGRLALAKWDLGDFLSPASAVPHYLRTSDAELEFALPKKR